MRDLCKVIDDILEVVPESYSLFRHDLLALRSSTEFSAPEMMNNWWWEVADCLAFYVEDCDGPWQTEVHRVWKGK